MAGMKAGSQAGSPAGNMRNPNQRGPRPQRVHVMPRRGKRGKGKGGGTADQRAASNAECQMSKYMVKMCQLSYLIWSRCYFITPNVRLCVSVAAVAAVAAVAVAAVRASAHNERCCSKAAGSAERREGG